jgi:hypothetical protein
MTGVSPDTNSSSEKHRPLSHDLVAHTEEKLHEFDRAPLAPVPWTLPVLRAVFASPCIPSFLSVAAAFRLWPINISNVVGTIASRMS